MLVRGERDTTSFSLRNKRFGISFTMGSEVVAEIPIS